MLNFFLTYCDTHYMIFLEAFFCPENTSLKEQLQTNNWSDECARDKFLFTNIIVLD